MPTSTTHSSSQFPADRNSNQVYIKLYVFFHSYFQELLRFETIIPWESRHQILKALSPFWLEQSYLWVIWQDSLLVLLIKYLRRQEEDYWRVWNFAAEAFFRHGSRHRRSWWGKCCQYAFNCGVIQFRIYKESARWSFISCGNRWIPEFWPWNLKAKHHAHEPNPNMVPCKHGKCTNIVPFHIPTIWNLFFSYDQTFFTGLTQIKCIYHEVLSCVTRKFPG